MRTKRHRSARRHKRQQKCPCKRVIGASQSVTRFFQHWDFDTLSDCGFSYVFKSCSEPAPASPSGRAFCPQKSESSNHKAQIDDTASRNPQKSRVFLHHPYTEYTIHIRFRDREIERPRAHFDISRRKFCFATLLTNRLRARSLTLPALQQGARWAHGKANMKRNRGRFRGRISRTPDRRHARRRCRA